MKAQKTLVLICALALLAVAVPATGDCLPCFSSPATFCGGPGDDYLVVPAGIVAAGNDGNDQLVGVANANHKICGNQDNDTVFGNNGNDNISGNGQNDYVGVSPGNDFGAGGNGDDRVDGSTNAGYDILNGGAGYDRCYFGESYTDCEYTFSP